MQSINIKIKNTLSRICNKFAGKFKQLLSLQGERLKRAKPAMSTVCALSPFHWRGRDCNCFACQNNYNLERG